MKLSINLSGKTLYTMMRQVGYAPTTSRMTPAGKPDEAVFQRFLGGRRYPRFHVYASISADRKTATLNLHLDQKQPSYKGTRAHGGEYDGPVVEAEAARIRSLTH